MNLFDAIFTHDPSSPAIRFGRRTITYGELRAQTLNMGQVVEGQGVARGDRIALLLHDSPEFVEAFIAICSLGAIAVPINMALPTNEQCSILHNSGAGMAFIEVDHCTTLLTHAPEKLRSLKNVVLVDRFLDQIEETEDSSGDHFTVTEMVKSGPTVKLNRRERSFFHHRDPTAKSTTHDP